MNKKLVRLTKYFPPEMGAPQSRLYETVIETLLSQGGHAQATCEALILRALDEGAPDNVSVVVVDLVAG